MSLSNLTNSRWVLKNNIEFSSDNIHFSINFTSYGVEYNTIVSDSHGLRYLSNDLDQIAYSRLDGWISSQYRIIRIIDGDDVENNTLINWLQLNGTQVSVTDLAGTMWTFNENLQYSTMHILEQPFLIYFYENVLFQSQLYDQIQFNTFGYNELTFRLQRQKTQLEFYEFDLENEHNSYWVYNVPTITIVGGIDTTNPDLIVWLDKNATFYFLVTNPISDFHSVAITEHYNHIVLSIDGSDFDIKAKRFYSISTFITNGTANGDVEILDTTGHATIMIKANNGYNLPGDIYVSGASYTYTISSNKLTIYLMNAHNNVTINAKCYPIKGSIIEMDIDGDGISERYRILNINNSNAELMAMYTPNSASYNSTTETITFNDGSVGIKYAEAELDTYLNTTWYNNLSSVAKSAIIDKNITEDMWYYGESGTTIYQGKYGTNDTTYQISKKDDVVATIGTRHVYALSVQDIIDYLEVTPSMTSENTTLTALNIWRMFWGTDSQPGTTEYPWLRSASASGSTNAWYINDYNGSIFNRSGSYSLGARPVFQIDLSKITWQLG